MPASFDQAMTGVETVVPVSAADNATVFSWGPAGHSR
jgi:hypothetical protein